MAVGCSSSSMRSSLRSISSRRRRIRERLSAEVMTLNETERGERPQPVDGGLARPGPLTQPAVVGEGACSIAFYQITFRLIPLSRSDPVPGLVHLRQTIAH